MKEQDHAKRNAGEASLHLIEDGMTIGLGSGSTVYWMLQALGERIKDGLDVKGVPSSRQTQEWAETFGVPLTDFSAITKLDATIDGADEVSADCQLIKGGGGALVREKIIAASSEKFYVIVDSSKMTYDLGEFPLPVEVVTFGWEIIVDKLRKLGLNPVIRKDSNEALFMTDNYNYIVDCHIGTIQDPKSLEQQLKQLTGVVDAGLFNDMTDEVIVGYRDHTEKLSHQSRF